MTSDEYLRVNEAAALLKVSRAKILRLIKKEKLVTYIDPRDGRATLIKRADLEPFLVIRPKEQ